jgi:hypothetical protein
MMLAINYQLLLLNSVERSFTVRLEVLLGFDVHNGASLAGLGVCNMIRALLRLGDATCRVAESSFT